MKLNFEKIAFAKVEAWAVFLFVLAGLAGLMLYGWFLRASLADPEATFWSRVAVNLSRVPERAWELSRTGLEFNAAGELVQRDPRNIPFEGPAGLERIDPGFEDDGYLLVSAYDEAHRNAVVELYDLQQGETVWQWRPDYQAIIEQTPSLARRLEGHTPPDFEAQHPYLVDGNLVFLMPKAGVLAMVDREGRPVWTLDQVFHHSIERNADGNFVVPTSTRQPGDREENCAYAVVSPAGEVLETVSVGDLLRRHGYGGLMRGVGPWEEDPTHLNDTQPMLVTDGHVQAGDIALSCRNISTVLLYRPGEDRIVWLQTGPWLNQHDVDYLGDGVFSIFNNNVLRGAPRKEAASSGIMTFDQKTGETVPHFQEVFREHNLQTETQGLHRWLANGDVFVELTDEHQLLRLGPEGPRWRYRHALAEPGRIGALFWCRYLPREGLNLSWLPEAQP
ncbi:MAG: arylsulfotransferase family protein [Verrucomicrobiota bacterium]